MSEPLYELTVNFKDLTDEDARYLTNWIVSSPRTEHTVYWISKEKQEDDGETEQTERIAKWIDAGAIPTDNPGEYVCTWKCSNCGKTSMSKTAYCPGCGARMEVNGDE